LTCCRSLSALHWAGRAAERCDRRLAAAPTGGRAAVEGREMLWDDGNGGNLVEAPVCQFSRFLCGA